MNKRQREWHNFTQWLDHQRMDYNNASRKIQREDLYSKIMSTITSKNYVCVYDKLSAIRLCASKIKEGEFKKWEKLHRTNKKDI